MTANRIHHWTKYLTIAGLVCVFAPARTAYGQEGHCVEIHCPDGRVVSCNSSCGSSGTSGGPSYSGPSAAQIEAERETEAERQRQQELERQRELERERAAEKQRQEEVWKQGVAAAAGSLKGVSPDNLHLKGTNTSSFGLKEISGTEAATNPTYGIKARAPDDDTRDVSTAWKQLHCAAELANYALADVRKIQTGAADARELDEVKYLAQEASNALHGSAVGVQCSAAPPMPSSQATSPSQLAPITEKLLSRAVQDAEKIVASRQKIEILRKQLDNLKTQNAAPANTPPPAVGSVPPGNTPAQASDQQKINDAIQKQKEYQKAHADYYALLRETQRALNDANSQKIASAADAAKVQQETQAILAGQLPSGTSGGGQNQTNTRKQPEDVQ